MKPKPARAILLALAVAGLWNAGDAHARPNVVLIITDDQGYGDLGFHGNPLIRTPHLDRLARESVRFDSFYVSPVCAPTRASLMTGRYNYRTGAIDTFRGRAMMHPDEVTIAEMLRDAGYRTGIFGKWHLGDNYPMRPVDQGFDEALVHRGGGIGQPSDPPGGTNYFDPILLHNGHLVRKQGYCSDVFSEAALRFITENRANSFFVYLAFNAPHTPLQVPPDTYRIYQGMNLAADQFPRRGQPLPEQEYQDVTARVYAMVSNIDDNVGRLLGKLDDLKLAENTLVLFLTDNGPQEPRYNAGMLQRKGSVHEGGIRVPFFVHWPGRLKAGRAIDRIAAHIDLAPTLLEACGVMAKPGVIFDGRSLWPLVTGRRVRWPERTLYFQWHRGDEPERYRAFAARSQRFKLVQPLGTYEGGFTNQLAFKLFDMRNDPYEMTDLAAQRPGIVKRMRRGYETWFQDVGSTRGFVPPRIHLGAAQENPLTLTRQDWRGPRATWTPNGLGHWEVNVTQKGTYDVTLRFAPLSLQTSAHFALKEIRSEHVLPAGASEWRFAGLQLPEGPAQLEAWLEQDGKTFGPHQVDVEQK